MSVNVLTFLAFALENGAVSCLHFSNT